MKSAGILTIIMALAVPLLAQQGGNIEGRVIDAETGKPLAGANVVIQGTTWGAASREDGSFRISDIPAGRYTLGVSYVGYGVRKRSVTVEPGQTMSLQLDLVPVILPGQEVVVTGIRAREGVTPVAFSNMSATEITQRYWAQDLPMLLSELPNVYAYSDNGNGIGYSYMRMRGFDQRRIGVMLNGVPLNDAESHEVFWVDLPDFAASTEDIQVQRGVGTSLYGASAFGGSVNVATISAVRTPVIEASLGRGSYNTRRYSVAGHSGLIDNTYAIYGRFSRIETDGYRRPSWSELWSYFIGVTRFDESMTTRINVFGGPEKSYLSYLGVTREALNDPTQRRQNPFQYPEEVDNFYQPHFQLINEWQINSTVTLENTFFTFLGFGHYTQFRQRRDLREYNMSRFIIRDSTLLPTDYYRNVDRDAVRDSFQVRSIDLVRKRMVDDVDFGWLPRLTLKSDKGELVLGGEFRRHRGHHWAEVIWANLLPPGVTPNWRYYDYVVPKTSLSLYAHQMYRLSNDISIMADLQVSHHDLRLTDERNHNVHFTRRYTFINPRAGLQYTFSPEWNSFVNISLAQREPAFKDIHNPQDYWSNPVNLPRNFRREGTGYEYIGKELKPEKFLNVEAGSGYRTQRASVKLNLYWMDFRDEIVASGQIDDNGVPISGNADRTVHRGIELSGSLSLSEGVTIAGNVAVNDDRFLRHTEYVVTDWNTSPPTTAPVVFDGNRLGGFPASLANLRLTFENHGWLASLHLQHRGQIYLDNSERDAYSIDPVLLLNGVVGYSFGSVFGLRSVDVRLFLNNLTNRLYAAAGYVEGNVAYFIPAAERNFFATVRVEL